MKVGGESVLAEEMRHAVQRPAGGGNKAKTGIQAESKTETTCCSSPGGLGIGKETIRRTTASLK